MEYLLKRYRKLNQKERKGFTLVELLVVIAILAVLASVSVVGYLGFTTKAKHSNAMTELSQAKEVIRAGLVDGNTHYYSLTLSDSTDKKEVSSAKEVTKSFYEGNTTSTENNISSTPNVTNGFTIQFTNSNTSTTSGLIYSGKGSYTVTWDSLLKAIFTDLKTFNGEFQVKTEDITDNSSGTSTSVKTISSIKYFGKNGGKAEWSVKNDSLSNGDSISEESTKTVTAS